MEDSKHALALVVSIVLVLLVASVGFLVGRETIPAYYGELTKPAWTPPAWLFGPVWTALYLMMAVGAWLVWCRAGGPDARGALSLYVAQLLLNAAWTPVFFGLRSPGGGLLVILPLVLLVVATTASFFRIQAVAGWLLVPYALWTAFATVLNVSIWHLQRGG